MKDKESSLDIYAFIKNYRKFIADSFIKKIYELGGGKFILQIHNQELKKGSFYIDITKGLSLMDAERGQEAGSLAMFLRKRLSDKKIKDIYQINFDRVVRIDMYNGYSIVMELFREGNLIILQDDIIEYAFYPREWRNRKIIKGEKYLPPSLTDPLSMTEEEKKKVLSESKASLVQTLATRFNLGGEFSEEILYRANIHKDLKSAEAFDKLEILQAQLEICLKETEENKGYFYEDLEMGSPIRLNFLKMDASKEFDNFNDLLCAMLESAPTESPVNIKIKRITESQERTIAEYEKLSARDRENGNFIASNFQTISKLINFGAKSDDTSLKIDGNEFTLISKDKAKKVLRLKAENGMELELFYDKSAGENMTRYYNSSKDYLERIGGAREALQNSLKGLVREQDSKKAQRQRLWFENYHWFYTKNEHLVISGKNTDTNEKVVKKHMGERDIYVHADMYGAPSTVIRNENNSEITEEEINEAAAFAVSFSRAWQNGLSSGSAYWVTPLQVSKTPESGQYVRKGSWIVRGKRNYLFDLPLKLTISLKEIKNMKIPMISPFREDNEGITIIPGNTKRDRVARDIAKKMDVDAEEILRILPSGNSDII